MKLVLSMMVMAFATAALYGCARPAVTTGAQPPAQTSEPDVAQMRLAEQVGGKIGVPVDVRYQLQGIAAQDQPAILQLAFVPRVAGTNLRVEFPAAAAVSIDEGSTPLAIAKADAAGSYRRSLLVTPRAGDAAEVRAIVAMDVNGGRYFGVFTIPVSPAQAQKQPGKNGSPVIR